jgi:hypothetical protein
MSEVSFVVSTVGLTIPFVITEPNELGSYVPISNALSANVTWFSNDGRRRALTLMTPVSALFVYTVSARDWMSPHTEVGRCFVSFGTNGFWTGKFAVSIIPHE